MPKGQGEEIYILIIIGGVLALMLVGFIVTMLFKYQQRRYKQEQELLLMKDQYEREALRSQLEIQENTFKNIGQELHDNIGQMLSVVKLSLAILPVPKEHAAYEPIVSARQMLNKAMMDLADLTKSLHTDRIAHIGLLEALRFELETLSKAGLLEIDFRLEGSERLFDEQKSIFLFRIFQEILNNVLKHSRATRLEMLLRYDEDNSFMMKISDNGVGFDVNQKKNSISSSSGVGLKSIFNRAKLIGADIEMDSKPGKGTIVTIQLSLQEK
ncbi:MAG: ATP-binding protein [Chitinophagaceae bacterium]